MPPASAPPSALWAPLTALDSPRCVSILQIKKEMNDDVEKLVNSAVLQCHSSLSSLLGVAPRLRGCATNSEGHAQGPNDELWCGHEARPKSPTARPLKLRRISR